MIFSSRGMGCSYLESGKVDDIVDVGVLSKHLVQRGLVCDVAFVEGGALAADELDAVDDLGGGVVEVVDDDDLVVGFEERKGREGADVARATAMCQCCYSKTRTERRVEGIGDRKSCKDRQTCHNCFMRLLFRPRLRVVVAGGAPHSHGGVEG
jgi:hypothetical protein